MKSGRKGAVRINEDTFKMLSERQRVHDSFVVEVQDAIEALGLTMVPLKSRRYGIIPSASFEQAPRLTVKNHLSAEVVRIRRDPEGAWQSFRQEVGASGVLEEVDDDE
jgi:hypothetical protein